jgi:hypothetical protein
MSIDTNIILELFNTLRDTDRDLSAKVEKQTDAIVTIGHNVSNIKDDIKQHLTDSKGMAECTETTESTVLKIWEKVKTMHKSVIAMITIVTVAFGLMVLAYFIVRNSVEDMIDSKIKQTQQIPTNNDVLVKEIEELRKQIKELHPPQPSKN